MAECFIVDAVRTAGGRRGGRLSGVHANDLGAAALNALLDRTNFDPGAVEDVIMGCVTQAGEQSNNIGRSAVLASRLPFSVPAVTIDRQCGSSQQAVQFAAQAVLSGTQDVVIAAGVESMSRVPMGSAALAIAGAQAFSDVLLSRLGVDSVSQFESAETIARKFGLSRDDLDAFALRSHERARAAIEAGAFDREIIDVPIVTADGVTTIHRQDEGVRFNASAAGLAGLKPVAEGGVITAGNASQICDGSAAVLVMSARALKDHGLEPRARIVNLTVTGGDPVNILEEPLYATARALKRAGLNIDDIDLYEVNEAFAPIPLAWLRHLDADPARLNVNGGAISLGHPLGASGAKLLGTLLHALEARGGRYGLQTMCEGGGLANVTVIEAL